MGFDDQRIRDAWNEVLDLWNTPGAVFEGLSSPTPGVGITEANFFESVFNLAAADECLMHRQAQFVSFAFDPDDARTFTFPADTADSSPAMGSGTFAVALRPDIEVQLVHQYLATAEYADARHAAQPGQFLSAVQGQDLSILGPLQRSFTETLQNAEVFRFDASDLMPPEIGASDQAGGFWFEGTNAVLGSGQIGWSVDRQECRRCNPGDCRPVLHHCPGCRLLSDCTTDPGQGRPQQWATLSFREVGTLVDASRFVHLLLTCARLFACPG